MMQIKSPSNSLVVPATFDSGDSITNRNSGEK